MKIEIKNRFNGEVIFGRDIENNTMRLTVEAAINTKASLRYADLRYADLRSADLSSADLRYADLSSANLRYADLSYANLSYADLRYADLSYANLSYADLRSADLRSADLSYAEYGEAAITKSPLHILGLTWPVLVLDSHIKIGCEIHLTSEWADYDMDTIALMEGRAADFWGKYKDLILSAAKVHQNL